MNQPAITLAVEGDSDEALARKILAVAKFDVSYAYVQGGKDRLDIKLEAFNHAAAHTPWFVLRDLDSDEDCAPELVRILLPKRNAKMILRIPVRAGEAWLLADRKSASKFLGVALAKLDLNPESLSDPKTTMVNLARKSRKKQIREDMVPAPNSTARVGPAYVSRLIEYASEYWDPETASKNSMSLARCLLALMRLREKLIDSV